eukprot:CAMPEP_0198736584 /NCGR_PEP_ID=MMETSP1475-20131203/66715_1 /TAXON_ID= ORGANISM="Unidentified sp., Strain CCMP1999" /NCGR_SAMPLE_ID=MMETSP1475 /ASSEMBLY_ACC=CAM_ASM_001111 /LENGTH=240 /DNA_ID=CAMNT_0044500413 /DNA_START=111 /DNA_END=835 /DNA_ORIENTATION=-
MEGLDAGRAGDVIDGGEGAEGVDVVKAGLLEFFDREGGAGAGKTGRSWSSSELRLKSVDDLRRLWFVLLREKTVLQTEREWCRANGMYWEHGSSNYSKVRQSMARLKGVMGERMRLYQNAKRFCSQNYEYLQLRKEAKKADAESLPFRDPMLEEIIRWEFSTISRKRRAEILNNEAKIKERLQRDRKRRREAWLLKKRATSVYSSNEPDEPDLLPTSSVKESLSSIEQRCTAHAENAAVD